MTPGRPDLGRTGAMDQGEGEIAEGGHNLWSMAGAQAGAVFPRSVTSRTEWERFSMLQWPLLRSSKDAGLALQDERVVIR